MRHLVVSIKQQGDNTFEIQANNGLISDVVICRENLIFPQLFLLRIKFLVKSLLRLY
jgi:hypothetical protein